MCHCFGLMLDTFHSAGSSSVDLFHDSYSKKHIHEIRESRDFTVRSINSTQYKLRHLPDIFYRVLLLRVIPSCLYVKKVRQHRIYAPRPSWPSLVDTDQQPTVADDGVAVVMKLVPRRMCKTLRKVDDYTIGLALVQCCLQTHHIRCLLRRLFILRLFFSLEVGWLTSLGFGGSVNSWRSAQ